MSFGPGFPIRSVPDWLAYPAAILGILAGSLTIGRYLYAHRVRIMSWFQPDMIHVMPDDGELEYAMRLRDFSYFPAVFTDSKGRLKVKLTDRKVNLFAFLYFKFIDRLQGIPLDYENQLRPFLSIQPLKANNGPV